MPACPERHHKEPSANSRSTSVVESGRVRPSRRNAATSKSQALSAASKGSSDGGAFRWESSSAQPSRNWLPSRPKRASGGARRSATVPGRRLGGRADEDHEIVPESQQRARERRRVYITGEEDHALAPRLGRELVERADRAAEIVLPAPDAVQIGALREGAEDRREEARHVA